MLLITIASPMVARADWPVEKQGSWDAYHEVDRFEWTNYDNGVHLLLGYSLSLTSGLLFEHKFKLTRLESALLGFLVGFSVGFVKEVFHDAYTSRTDLKCWAAGAASGSLTLLVFRF